MAGAIRMVSLSRGHDPRDFALFAFGGAGPLHAAALARELAIPKVLIPARPGLTNALGCVVADLRHDFVATVNQPLEALDEGRIGDDLRARRSQSGRALLAREDVAVERVVTLHRADMQFQGQSHILPVRDRSTATSRSTQLRAVFAAAYWKRFGVELPEIRPVLVNLHTGGDRPAQAGLAARDRGDRRRRRRSPRHGARRGRSGSTAAGSRRRSMCATLLPVGARFDGPGDRRAARLHDRHRARPTASSVDAIGNLIVSVAEPGARMNVDIARCKSIPSPSRSCRTA